MEAFSKGALINGVQNSNYYSFSFDGLHNRVTQSSEMDVMVRCLDHSDYLVKTRYVTSEFLGPARHNDRYQNFPFSAERMDEKKLLHVWMDGPSVNLKFLRLLQSERKKKDI